MKRTATVAAIAAIVVLGGTGAYASGSVIGTENVKNNTLTSADIKNESLTGRDVDDASLSGADLANGTVTGADIKNGSLTAYDLAPGSIGVGQLKGDAVQYLVDMAKAQQGGGQLGKLVGYSRNTGNEVVSDAFTGQDSGTFLVVMNASYTIDVPVRVALANNSGNEFGACVADPAGFGKASCSLTVPAGVSAFSVSSVTAAGENASGVVDFTYIKVG